MTHCEARRKMYADAIADAQADRRCAKEHRAWSRKQARQLGIDKMAKDLARWICSGTFDGLTLTSKGLMIWIYNGDQLVFRLEPVNDIVVYCPGAWVDTLDDWHKQAGADYAQRKRAVKRELAEIRRETMQIWQRFPAVSCSC